MNVASIRGKIHTIIDAFGHLRMLSKVGAGVIPETYCRLDQKWLHSYQFDTILDVGANVGRFAVTADAVFPAATIYAFEPLPACYDKTAAVIETIGKGKAFNFGLGVRTETAAMNQNEFSPSSSFLPMNRTHLDAFPFTAKQKQTLVQVKRLDDVAEELCLGSCILIKIDVQGYERDVIAGGKDTIAKAKVILIELSYEELYSGQPLFGEVYDALRALGFRFVGTMAQMPHPKDGRLLDADCLFVKD